MKVETNLIRSSMVKTYLAWVKHSRPQLFRSRKIKAYLARAKHTFFGRAQSKHILLGSRTFENIFFRSNSVQKYLACIEQILWSNTVKIYQISVEHGRKLCHFFSRVQSSTFFVGRVRSKFFLLMSSAVKHIFGRVRSKHTKIWSSTVETYRILVEMIEVKSIFGCDG